MAYFEPYIDETGLHIPTYIDIREYLVLQAKSIFGEDIYLEPDSQDYEFISLIADKYHHACLLAQYIHNNRDPTFALGESLSTLVKINGLRRKQQTKSTCEVIITGEPKTTITNGIVADKENINWELPETVYIGLSGQTTVIVTCQEYSHSALSGEITKIVTPTAGWETVINEADAVKGQEYETDNMLRARRAISTAKPSLTMIDGLDGGIAEIEGVTRHRLYENDTNITDEHGIPGHHIALVVEGGKNEDIAYEIELRKGVGAGTYGDIEYTIITVNPEGETDYKTICFFRPTYKDIYVNIGLKPLKGYTETIKDQIIENVNNYINSLRIGTDLNTSTLWAVALNVMNNLTAPVFSITNITVGFTPDELQPEDLEIKFNEVTQSSIENITITLI